MAVREKNTIPTPTVTEQLIRAEAENFEPTIEESILASGAHEQNF